MGLGELIGLGFFFLPSLAKAQTFNPKNSHSLYWDELGTKTKSTMEEMTFASSLWKHEGCDGAALQLPSTTIVLSLNCHGVIYLE